MRSPLGELWRETKHEVLQSKHQASGAQFQPDRKWFLFPLREGQIRETITASTTIKHNRADFKSYKLPVYERWPHPWGHSALLRVLIRPTNSARFRFAPVVTDMRGGTMSGGKGMRPLEKLSFLIRSESLWCWYINKISDVSALSIALFL
jgi:hypothetical protein